MMATSTLMVSRLRVCLLTRRHVLMVLVASEFVAVMSRKVNATYTQEQVKSAFKVSQPEQSLCGCLCSRLSRCVVCFVEQIFEGTAPTGHIKVSDLLNALTKYGTTKLTAEQAAELVGQVRFTLHVFARTECVLTCLVDIIGQLEPDANGLVNYVEYVNMMMAE